MPLQQMLRDQEREYADLNKGIAAMDARIAGLDRGLRDDARTDRIAAIREEAAGPLRSLVGSMAARAKDAAEVARRTSPRAELRRARFSPDEAVNSQVLAATLARLSKTPLPELIEHLEDAAASRNLAMVEAVRLEFSGREGREEFKEQYAEVFATVHLPKSSEAEELSGKIASLAGLALERFDAAVRGRSDPIARMAAARLNIALQRQA